MSSRFFLWFNIRRSCETNILAEKKIRRGKNRRKKKALTRKIKATRVFETKKKNWNKSVFETRRPHFPLIFNKFSTRYRSLLCKYFITFKHQRQFFFLCTTLENIRKTLFRLIYRLFTPPFWKTSYKEMFTINSNE